MHNPSSSHIIPPTRAVRYNGGVPTLPRHPKVDHIFYYPVKGLGGTTLADASVAPGRGIAFDRQFGLATTPTTTPADSLTARGTWQPWHAFLSLKKTPACMELIACMREVDGQQHLVIRHRRSGNEAVGNPDNPADRQRLEAFIRDGMLLPAGQPLFLIDCKDEPIWDEQGMPLSLVNADTAAALGALCGGLTADEVIIRLRPNIVFSGMPMWGEESTAGTIRTIPCESAGSTEVQLDIARPIPRCAATTVNPATSEIDINIPQVLVRARGHNECGIYAHTTTGGKLAVDDRLHFIP